MPRTGKEKKKGVITIASPLKRVTPPGEAPKTVKVVKATVKQDGRSLEAELRYSPACVMEIWQTEQKEQKKQRRNVERDIRIMTGGMKLEL